jgi:ferredoxin
MAKYKVEVDTETCIGCGACTSCDNFELADNGKAKPKESELEEVGCSKEAADNCPVSCIKITEL